MQERRQRNDQNYEPRDRPQGRNRGGDLDTDWEQRLKDSRKGKQNRTRRHGRKRR